MRNALTFDVEEYFHAEAFAGLVGIDDWPRLASRVAKSTRHLLDALDEQRTLATFFVLGWLAERDPALIREIHARGHEVACHSYGHRLIYRMDREAFQADARRAKRVIEDAIGAAVLGYRAPTFSVVRDTLWCLEVLAEEGFAYDSSIFPIHHDRYGISDAHRFPHRVTLPGGKHIAEFPISTVRVGGQHFPFSGGGYFRLAPYRLVRGALLHLNNRERMPAIVYLHPWELDSEQPRLGLRGLSRLRHYVNIQQTARKLERLLTDFTFAPVSQILGEHGLVEAMA
jgi:polysaccharide deacetylase family protein (PEP-CTERM system associated)